MTNASCCRSVTTLSWANGRLGRAYETIKAGTFASCHSPTIAFCANFCKYTVLYTIVLFWSLFLLQVVRCYVPSCSNESTVMYALPLPGGISIKLREQLNKDLRGYLYVEEPQPESHMWTAKTAEPRIARVEDGTVVLLFRCCLVHCSYWENRHPHLDTSINCFILGCHMFSLKATCVSIFWLVAKVENDINALYCIVLYLYCAYLLYITVL